MGMPLELSATKLKPLKFVSTMTVSPIPVLVIASSELSIISLRHIGASAKYNDVLLRTFSGNDNTLISSLTLCFIFLYFKFRGTKFS